MSAETRDQIHGIEEPPVRLQGVLGYLIRVCEDSEPLKMSVVVDDMSSGASSIRGLVLCQR